MNKSLLDTDIFSEILKGRDQNVKARASAYRRTFGSFSISSVTVMEVVKGLHKVRREAEIQAVLARLVGEEILGFDQAAGELAGRIHADLERIGQLIGWADIVIAAIALRHGLVLVTGNTAHDQRIQADRPASLAC